MPFRCVLFGLTAFLLAAPAAAHANAELEHFLQRNTCQVAKRLETLDELRARPDRFIVISIGDGGQRYVQCLFPEQPDTLICEASSGYYGPPPGQEGNLQLSGDALAILRAAGFDTAVAEGNFPVALDIRDRRAFPEIADMLLTALYRAYGGSAETLAEITAPLAEELPAGACPMRD